MGEKVAEFFQELPKKSRISFYLRSDDFSKKNQKVCTINWAAFAKNVLKTFEMSLNLVSLLACCSASAYDQCARMRRARKGSSVRGRERERRLRKKCYAFLYLGR